jgi:HEAT repeat protein
MPLIRKDPTQPAQPQAGPDQHTALTSGSSEERWAAARALSRGPDAVTVLGPALATERDPRVREAIFTGLTTQNSAAAVEVLLPYLRSDDAATRTGVLDALGAMPQMAAAYLPAMLGDADSDVRLLSCEIARRLPAAQATLLLCTLLEREEAVNVVAAAVEVLSEVGEPAALPVLKDCARRFAGNGFLGFAIDMASKRIGEGRARVAGSS